MFVNEDKADEDRREWRDLYQYCRGAGTDWETSGKRGHVMDFNGEIRIGMPTPGVELKWFLENIGFIVDWLIGSGV